MLTVNKLLFNMPASNIQNSRNQNSPKLQTINQDTVSFSGWFSTPKRTYVSDAVMEAVKKAEAENPKVTFFNTLRELCERAENDDLSGKVDADAQMLFDDYANKANELFDLIINDSDTDSFLKIVATRLKKRVGLNPVR